MVFNVGDKVWVELLVIGTSGYMIQVQSDVDKKPYQTAVSGWAHASDLRSSAGADIKQAIRELLLSDEFLQAFSRAYMETPCIPAYEMKLAIEPITGSESEAVALRNRFGIGDKVVDRCTGSLAIVKNINESDGECEIQFEENHRYAYRWGSELSLFKKKVSDCKPSSIDASAINQNGESK